VVGEDERQHRFDDRAGAQGDAGVVSAFGDDFHILSVAVGATAGNEDAAGCLESGTGDDGLAARYATQDTACVVRQEHGTDIDAACGQLRSNTMKRDREKALVENVQP